MTKKKELSVYIDTPEAMEIASGMGFPVTTATIRNWCHHYEMSVKIGGRWKINRDKFLEFLKGEVHV